MAQTEVEKCSKNVATLQGKMNTAFAAFQTDNENEKKRNTYVASVEAVTVAQAELNAALLAENAENKKQVDEAIAANEAKVDEAIAANETKVGEAIAANETKIDEAVESVKNEDEDEVTESDVRRKHNEFMQMKKDEAAREFSNQKYPNRYGIAPSKKSLKRAKEKAKEAKS